MLRTAAGFALVFTSLTITAQSGSNSGTAGSGVAGSSTPGVSGPQVHVLANGNTVVTLPLVEGACPIGMHASQSLWNHTIAVQKGLGNERFGQRISLNLKESHPGRIIEATVRVKGLNGKSRMLLTPTGMGEKWNATRILKVKFVEENDGSVTGDLWIAGFTAVTSVELLDVSYSDGSTWSKSGLSGCRVQPDPLMLITER